MSIAKFNYDIKAKGALSKASWIAGVLLIIALVLLTGGLGELQAVITIGGGVLLYFMNKGNSSIIISETHFTIGDQTYLYENVKTIDRQAKPAAIIIMFRDEKKALILNSKLQTETKKANKLANARMKVSKRIKNRLVDKIKASRENQKDATQ